MRALRFHAPHDVRVETAPEPRIEHPGDVLVRVEAAGLCGSDLHVWHGRETGLDAGTVMGHELVGEVVEVGREAAAGGAPAVGTRVVSPFTTSCGECFYCRRGLTSRCERGELFGWVESGRGLHGAQAEYVRVPLAASTLVPVPDGLDPVVALLAGDVLATGYFGAELAGAGRAGGGRMGGGRVGGSRAGGGQGAGGRAGVDRADRADQGRLSAGISRAETVVVVGCGAVGLAAVVGALELGAERVWAVDRLSERLELARRLGAEPVRLGEGLGSGSGGETGATGETGAGFRPNAVSAGHEQADAGPVALVREATGGRGADAVVEAVGTPGATRLAIDLVRPGGTVAAVGVHTERHLAFSPVEAYDKNLTYRAGRCPARRYTERLLGLLGGGATPFPEVVTHRVPLEHGAEVYETFAARRGGCVKAVLVP